MSSSMLREEYLNQQLKKTKINCELKQPVLDSTLQQAFYVENPIIFIFLARKNYFCLNMNKRMQY
ncbi:hypothetical protein BpHYR1_034518 [Brachionus plicatilis]|uniref:Uncharacterized protein n=1 Tax=Brachionus plicatilis TaxID=10195 RepID=A0A3M7RPS0_BRAPC|nr:hypothetical protein BpHYR1_034518 [Brachionus plicatilis]